MKNMFKKYSQIISLDFTFKLIKDKHPNGKQWKAGYIVGNSLSKRIIPFAIMLILQETADVYYRLIRAFTNIMGHSPQIIATDESQAAKSAIEQLKNDRQFQGVHVLDLFHILKNVRKKIKDKSQISYYSQLAACKHNQQFERVLQKVYQKIDINEINILEEFVKNSHRYCFS